MDTAVAAMSKSAAAGPPCRPHGGEHEGISPGGIDIKRERIPHSSHPLKTVLTSRSLLLVMSGKRTGYQFGKGNGSDG